MIIELKGVAKSYRGKVDWYLEKLDLSVEKGEIFSILGPSGCGKTTVLRLIAGFERPDTGEIVLNGETVVGKGILVPPERRGIGMVFQEFALFPHLNVAENIAFGIGGLSRRERFFRVQEVLEYVELEGYRRHYPHELSGGQQQRVALARAMAPKPSVILLDEPFSNLDADLRGHVASDVHRVLKETNSTAILVTHDHEEAFTMADQMLVMNGGRVEQQGTPHSIYHLPANRFIAEFVGPMVFISGTVTHEGIQTAFGSFPNQDQLLQGTPVDLLVRPDDIELEADTKGNAVVVGRKFRGSENIYTVQADTGETLLSTQRSHTEYCSGQRVKVRTELKHIVVFKQEGKRRIK
jgi:iron(III) transport system ATP-binding protein